MARKFKPGDRVLIARLGVYYPEPEQGLFVNNLATVREYTGEHDAAYVLVATDGDSYSSRRGLPSVWSFEENELELLGDYHG